MAELIRHSQSDYQSGVDIMQELLDLDDPPTAVFAANNLLALGALKAINDNGIAIRTIFRLSASTTCTGRARSIAAHRRSSARVRDRAQGH